MITKDGGEQERDGGSLHTAFIIHVFTSCVCPDRLCWTRARLAPALINGPQDRLPLQPLAQLQRFHCCRINAVSRRQPPPPPPRFLPDAPGGSDARNGVKIKLDKRVFT